MVRKNESIKGKEKKKKAYQKKYPIKIKLRKLKNALPKKTKMLTHTLIPPQRNTKKKKFQRPCANKYG